jgi:hypothetical protein
VQDVFEGEDGADGDEDGVEDEEDGDVHYGITCVQEKKRMDIREYCTRNDGWNWREPGVNMLDGYLLGLLCKIVASFVIRGKGGKYFSRSPFYLR